MVNAFKLLLPGLIPSWEFFKSVEPSPRVQWRLLADPDEDGTDWQEFRPRPAQISPFTMLLRLFWNPTWNESLYMVSLAERLMLNPTSHSVHEIQRRLAAELDRSLPLSQGPPYLQFRIVFVSRNDEGLVQTITYVGDPCLFDDIAL